MRRQDVIHIGSSDSEEDEPVQTSRRVTRSSAKRMSLNKQHTDAMVIEDRKTPEKKKKTIMLEDGLDVTLYDESDEELEQTIRVVWSQTGEVDRFNLKPSENITSIYEFFSKKYVLPIEKVKIRNGDNVVSMYDTVQSLKLRVTNVLEAYAVKENQDDSCRISGNGKIEIKCLLQVRKKPVVFYLHPQQKVSCLIPECAKETNSTVDKVILKFDGENIEQSETPASLGLEGGECFEVHIKS